MVVFQSVGANDQQENEVDQASLAPKCSAIVTSIFLYVHNYKIIIVSFFNLAAKKFWFRSWM